jgi:hypothetical protein
MNRTESKIETQDVEAVSSQGAMLKQIGFHGVLVMCTVLLITGLLKAF